jgi:hypothetical protein
MRKRDDDNNVDKRGRGKFCDELRDEPWAGWNELRVVSNHTFLHRGHLLRKPPSLFRCCSKQCRPKIWPHSLDFPSLLAERCTLTAHSGMKSSLSAASVDAVSGPEVDIIEDVYEFGSNST